MGTDIHGVWQKKTIQGWENIESAYQQSRHYQLFAVLAGIRNGTGFAGVPTGQVITPISNPRGLPVDFQLNRTGYMGDHSYSWLSGEEMLHWFATAPIVIKTGVIDRQTYETWDKISRPSSYCGDIWGKFVVKINDNEVEKNIQPNWTHIFCTWEAPLKEELKYFFDEVDRLMKLHGEIRFVFGFDS